MISTSLIVSWPGSGKETHLAAPWWDWCFSEPSEQPSRGSRKQGPLRTPGTDDDPHIVAAADDINIIGTNPDKAYRLHQLLQQALEQQGYALNSDKTVVAYLSHVTHQAPSDSILNIAAQLHTNLQDEGFSVCKIPYGTPGYVANLMQQHVVKHHQFAQEICQPEFSFQDISTLLRQSLHPRPIYWARAVPIELWQTQAKAMSDINLAVLFYTAQVDPDSFRNPPPLQRATYHYAAQQAALPLRLGGCGLRPYAPDLALAAYLGGLAQAAPEMALRRVKWPEQYAYDALKYLRLTTDNVDLNTVVPADIATPQDFATFLIGLPPTRKFQKQLTAATDKAKLRQLYAALPRDHQHRLTALRATGAAWWLMATTTSPHTRMMDQDFSVALRMRLGFPPHPQWSSFVDSMPTCAGNCRWVYDSAEFADVNHPLTCRANMAIQGRRRHDCVVQVLRNLVLDAAGFVHTEAHPLEGDNHRPDLHAAYATSNDLVDAVITHPLAQSYVQAGPSRYRVAYKAARSKRRKYAEYAREMGARFIPFACESLGGIIPEARRWMAAVALSLPPDYCTPEGLDRFQLLRHAQSAVAIAIQRGNAAMVKASVNRALPGARRVPDRPRSLLPELVIQPMDCDEVEAPVSTHNPGVDVPIGQNDGGYNTSHSPGHLINDPLVPAHQHHVEAPVPHGDNVSAIQELDNP